MIRGLDFFPLHDSFALDDWWDEAGPSVNQWNVVVDWVYGLEYAYWQWPSRPIEEMCARPVEETRLAVVPESGGVAVLYRYHYIRLETDLIWIY